MVIRTPTRQTGISLLRERLTTESPPTLPEGSICVHSADHYHDNLQTVLTKLERLAPRGFELENLTVHLKECVALTCVQLVWFLS